MNFCGKKPLSVFKYFNYLQSRQKSEKTNMSFLRKMLNWRMDGQTDARTDRQSWFCRTLFKTVVQLLKWLQAFLNTRNQFILLISLWDTANFRFLQREWAHPFMPTSIAIFFDQLLIPMNSYQHAKNRAFSSFYSIDMIYLKILQSDWPKTLSNSKSTFTVSKVCAMWRIWAGGYLPVKGTQ